MKQEKNQTKIINNDIDRLIGTEPKFLCHEIYVFLRTFPKDKIEEAFKFFERLGHVFFDRLAGRMSAREQVIVWIAFCEVHPNPGVTLLNKSYLWEGQKSTRAEFQKMKEEGEDCRDRVWVGNFHRVIQDSRRYPDFERKKLVFLLFFESLSHPLSQRVLSKSAMVDGFNVCFFEDEWSALMAALLEYKGEKYLDQFIRTVGELMMENLPETETGQRGVRKFHKEYRVTITNAGLKIA